MLYNMLLGDGCQDVVSSRLQVSLGQTWCLIPSLVSAWSSPF